MSNITLVTGVNGHIARELAKSRVDLGETVFGIDLTEECIVPGVLYVQCDLKDSVELKRACSDIRARGEVTNFVHCAAMTAASAHEGWSGPLSGQSVELWNQALAVNLTSAFIIAKELFTGPSTLADRRIILLSSIYGALAPDKLIYEGQVMSNPAAYGVSKSGLEALGRYLASELGPVVKVNSIRLGGVERQQRPEFIEAYNRKTILGRMAAENDVQPALAFLLDPENSYMTGSIVDLEGGLSII